MKSAYHGVGNHPNCDPTVEKLGRDETIAKPIATIVISSWIRSCHMWQRLPDLDIRTVLFRSRQSLRLFPSLIPAIEPLILHRARFQVWKGIFR